MERARVLLAQAVETKSLTSWGDMPISRPGRTTSASCVTWTVWWRSSRFGYLLETNEAFWAAGLDAERERSVGMARDLATVRAELADGIPAEASTLKK